MNTPYTYPEVDIYSSNGTAVGNLKEGEELTSTLAKLAQEGTMFKLYRHESDTLDNPMRLEIDLGIEDVVKRFENWYNFTSYGY